jgi:hypothetical protein
MKGVGRRNSTRFILHESSELVAAAKSAGLSPANGGELRRDDEFARLLRAFKLRLKGRSW